MTYQLHVYYMVKPSLWFLMGVFLVFLMTFGLAMWFYFYFMTFFMLGLLTNTLTMY